MTQRTSSLLVRAGLTLGVLVPYGRLATFRGLVVTDDRIVSDIYNGEFPARVAIGVLVKSGVPPVWLPGACGGFPLVAGGGGATDPVTLTLFSLFSPVVALNLFLLSVLLLAAHSTYSFAREIRVRPAGAMLAAFAYAHSGYVACQLKHLSIVLVVAWFPLALLFLERALGAARSAPPAVETPPPGDVQFGQGDVGPSLQTDDAASIADDTRRRLRSLSLFALVFGAQSLAGFPQSVYICGLLYGCYALARAASLRGTRRVSLLGAFTIACVIGGAMGAVLMLPMAELARLSDRSAGVGMDWIRLTAYWPPDIASFVVPYAHGDVSDGTYVGHAIFWEDYGYVGVVTLGLALFAAVSGMRKQAIAEVRRAHVIIFVTTAVVAYLIVLGPATPLFPFLFKTLPGMRNFRFPTRFLFLVDFAIAVLGGVGLSRLEQAIAGRSTQSLAAIVAWAVAACSLIDVLHANLRQNAIVDATAWMTPPASAAAVRNDDKNGSYRIFTPGHYMQHSAAFWMAKGWANTEPYFAFRDLIQPNSNLLWGLSSGDCYAGLAPASTVEMWGDHNARPSALGATYRVEPGRTVATPGFFRILALNNVKYILTQWDLRASKQVELLDVAGNTQIYRVLDALPRAYVVHHARLVANDIEARPILASKSFKARFEVVLHEAPQDVRSIVEEDLPAETPAPSNDAEGTVANVPVREDDAVRVASYGPNEVVVEASTQRSGLLVLSDTWYPSWRAEVDGREAPILRANLTYRAVELSPGKHVVRFRFVSKSIRNGLLVTLSATAIVLSCVFAFRPAKRRRNSQRIRS